MSEFDDVGNPIANPWERMTFREAAIDGRCSRCGGAQWEAKRSAKNKALGYAALGVGGALAASKDLVECVTCGLRLGRGEPSKPRIDVKDINRRARDSAPETDSDGWMTGLQSRFSMTAPAPNVGCQSSNPAAGATVPMREGRPAAARLHDPNRYVPRRCGHHGTEPPRRNQLRYGVVSARCPAETSPSVCCA
jgi:hypothetical protein